MVCSNPSSRPIQVVVWCSVLFTYSFKFIKLFLDGFTVKYVKGIGLYSILEDLFIFVTYVQHISCEDTQFYPTISTSIKYMPLYTHIENTNCEFTLYFCKSSNSPEMRNTCNIYVPTFISDFCIFFIQICVSHFHSRINLDSCNVLCTNTSKNFNGRNFFLQP